MHTEQSQDKQSLHTNQEKGIIDDLQSVIGRNFDQITNLGSIHSQAGQFTQDSVQDKEQLYKNLQQVLVKMNTNKKWRQKKKEISIKKEVADKQDRYKRFRKKILQRKLMNKINENQLQLRKQKKKTSIQKFKIRSAIQQKQRQMDNIMSLREFMPKIREQKKFQMDADQITQEKLEEIFLIAQQSVSESDSSSSGSYILVNESQLLRLKKGFLYQRIKDGIIKQKTIDLKERIFKKLDQYTNAEKINSNRQELYSDKPEDSQKQSIPELTSSHNQKLQEQRSYNDQIEVEAGVNEQDIGLNENFIIKNDIIIQKQNKWR